MASQTIYFALLALTISSCTGTLCSPKCPRIYQPVCAENNYGQTKTFSNLCLMDYESCINRDEQWRFVQKGECGFSANQCPQICPLIYAPICGINNYGLKRTFENKCVLEATQCSDRAAGWKVFSDQECASVLSVECPTFCPFNYDPICGQDQTGNMKTFANLCTFKMEQCNNRAAAWKIVAETSCIQPLAEISKCPIACTDDLSPVCGVSNTGVLKTFENKCMFEMEDCNNRDAGWKFLSKGVCNLKKKLSNVEESRACNGICTREYVPVCAQDNTGNMKTFGNKCMFEFEQCNNRDAGWKVIGQGECNLKRELSNEQLQTCNQFCTMEYMPVCAQDSTGNMKTFGNKCSFELEQCNNRDAGWKVIGQGECNLKRELSNDEKPRACNGFCTKEYVPVCAQDSTGNMKTFGNKCMFEFEQCNNRDAGWKVIGQGECNLKRELSNEELQTCNRFCTMEYMPVCAQDSTGNMKTFGNKCSFELEQCNNRDAGWRLLSHGECNLRRKLSNDEESRACNSICTAEYKPVCAQDNTGNMKTFGNKCTFEAEQCNNRDAGWKIVRFDECPGVRHVRSLPFNCPLVCPQIYAPVEGINAFGERKVFENECQYRAAKCFNPSARWTLSNA